MIASSGIIFGVVATFIVIWCLGVWYCIYNLSRTLLPVALIWYLIMLLTAALFTKDIAQYIAILVGEIQ